MDQQQTPKLDTQTGFTGGLAAGALLLWDFLKIVLIALAIIIPVRYLVFQPFVVNGSSMEPNFYHAEYLIIDELSFLFGDPQRGDVVVFHPPVEGEKDYYIKRVIALPGEKVQVEDGIVTVFNQQHPNGLELNEPYLPSQNLTFPHDQTIVGGRKVLSLGQNEYFVMGDNRLASSDSRDWGVLKRDAIVGKVFLRLLPLKEFDVFRARPAYNF